MLAGSQQTARVKIQRVKCGHHMLAGGQQTAGVKIKRESGIIYLKVVGKQGKNTERR